MRVPIMAVTKPSLPLLRLVPSHEMRIPIMAVDSFTAVHLRLLLSQRNRAPMMAVTFVTAVATTIVTSTCGARLLATTAAVAIVIAIIT